MKMEDLLKQIRRDMMGTKNQWVFKTYSYKNKTIQTKRWNNWFQIFRVNGKNYSMPMDTTQRNVLNRIKRSLGG